VRVILLHDHALFFVAPLDAALLCLGQELLVPNVAAVRDRPPDLALRPRLRAGRRAAPPCDFGCAPGACLINMWRAAHEAVQTASSTCNAGRVWLMEPVATPLRTSRKFWL